MLKFVLILKEPATIFAWKTKGNLALKKQIVERHSAPWRCLCLCLCESFIREAGQRILFDGFQLPAPTSVDRETLGWILDLWVISSTPGTQCNLWECMAIFVLFFSRSCTWTLHNVKKMTMYVWGTHCLADTSEFQNKYFWKQVWNCCNPFGFWVFFVHWARMCAHDRKRLCTQFTVAHSICLNHLNATNSPPVCISVQRLALWARPLRQDVFWERFRFAILLALHTVCHSSFFSYHQW